MTERIKRIKGPAQGNFATISEDRLLGPYPSWERWKPSLLRQLGEKVFDGFEEPVKEFLHLHYIIHRKTQLGLPMNKDLERYQLLEEELGGREKIHENPKIDFALNFINNR